MHCAEREALFTMSIGYAPRKLLNTEVYFAQTWYLFLMTCLGNVAGYSESTSTNDKAG